ncbi:MAG: TIGR03915 family putative DNA repair protein [Eubacteriaceae bacterium]|nr:TIGR03915 family putative DNA repair protein [Eubacteriaceae bacterium]
MIDYLYDGTFEGLLTCIYEHYYDEKTSGIFERDSYQASMLQPCRMVGTDDEKADIVYNAIKEKISAYDLGRVYKVFRSCVHDRETKILNYVRLGFSKGSAVSMLHGNPIVFDIQSAEKKVNREIDRLNGLIRFTVLGEKVLYSPVEPDNDVIEFLANHFCDRYKNEPFMIHDLKRKKALVYSGNRWYITEFTVEELPPMAPGEQVYRELWKNYFDTIAIKQRINPRCQKNFMPVRYWQHLTEMQGRRH